MEERAFPVIFARRVSATASFYERFGFIRQAQNPPQGEPSYVGLRRGAAELTVVDYAWPARQHGGGSAGSGPRYEMFVFVDDVDASLARLKQDSVPVLRDPMDLPWGERIAYVADPDGNPVALASETAPAAAGHSS